MRDLILLLALVAIIPFIFKRPVVGALAYCVVSLMNPHRLTYGFAQTFPFAMILCVVTLVAFVLSREQRKLPSSPAVWMLLIFFAWTTLCTVFAQMPKAAWSDWDRFSKIILMVIVTIMTVRTRKDVQALAFVVAMSLGFWGFKSGLFVIFSGGGEGMFGPRKSFISDNNTLALALVTATPLLVYLITRADTKWLKRGAIAIAALTVLGAIGSYSRGAMLGAFMMGFFLWLKSPYKAKLGLVLVLIVPLVLLAMPEQWMGRMQTIQTYQEDASATGRINSWMFAINIADEFLLGGGPNVFSPYMFMLYAPEPDRYYDAHSIYFQILGEQGYIGLVIFLLMFLVAWRTGARVIRFCRDKEDLGWALMLARMCHVSMIGYLTAGAFLTLAYYDLIYYVIAILITLDKVLIRAPQKDDIPPLRHPLLDRLAQRFLGRPPPAAQDGTQAGKAGAAP
ncbi:putative O-glycosylation ligase, exosortase A system-associated [Massilia arenae]|uniref:Putative O-glycosylation ligase, exosortase A system-associated n=1 Tax=Massilia arenae TaxID=2603288 RepID=A0A5C7G3K9_9BURK|nr:putative O-glycosylation ligase, exosortase A system-associated [Massilia arenae]TXF99446.1 putative O-glycosylation ligase, exosortase A system-associated [Massilia arenae]